MARRPAPFTQADVTRLVRGVRAAGVDVGQVEVTPDGRIVLTMAGQDPEASELPLDSWRRANAS
jgi:hypothetical protein